MSNKLGRSVLSLIISWLSCSAVCAQTTINAGAQEPLLPITAAAAADRVRITAPSSIVQMHVEVYAANGEKLFDNQIRGGNVFDWHLQDGQAQRLAAGDYVCVVTVKSVAGKLMQTIGAVTVGDKRRQCGGGGKRAAITTAVASHRARGGKLFLDRVE
jgi:hypothetical protein